MEANKFVTAKSRNRSSLFEHSLQRTCSRNSRPPIQLTQLSKRFHHQLLRYVSRVRKPALDRRGHSFESGNSRINVLIACSQNGSSSESSSLRFALTLRFVSKPLTDDPSSSAICRLYSPPSHAEARAPVQSASQHCVPEQSRPLRSSRFQSGSAPAESESSQFRSRPAKPGLAGTILQTFGPCGPAQFSISLVLLAVLS